VPRVGIQAVLDRPAEGREISTTQAYSASSRLLRDKVSGARGAHLVDRGGPWHGSLSASRHHNPAGQNYTAVDKDQVMYYREAKDGRSSRTASTRPGRDGEWIAAATSYSTNTASWCRIYVYTRCSAPAHRRPRLGGGRHAGSGFRLGAPRRTTLNGEVCRRDGHSHILAGTIPNCASYLRARGGVIMQHGLKRMVGSRERLY